MNPVFPIEVAAGGLTGKAGYLIKIVNGAPTLVAAATDKPAGALDHYLSDTKGGLAIGGSRTRVKVTGAVAQFAYGKVNADATVSAYTGEAGEVLCCQFLQAGTDGELVNAIIIA